MKEHCKKNGSELRRFYDPYSEDAFQGVNERHTRHFVVRHAMPMGIDNRESCEKVVWGKGKLRMGRRRGDDKCGDENRGGEEEGGEDVMVLCYEPAKVNFAGIASSMSKSKMNSPTRRSPASLGLGRTIARTFGRHLKPEPTLLSPTKHKSGLFSNTNFLRGGWAKKKKKVGIESSGNDDEEEVGELSSRDNQKYQPIKKRVSKQISKGGLSLSKINPHPKIKQAASDVAGVLNNALNEKVVQLLVTGVWVIRKVSANVTEVIRYVVFTANNS